MGIPNLKFRIDFSERILKGDELLDKALKEQ